MALAYLRSLQGELPPLPFLEQVPPAERETVIQMVDGGFNAPLTSSCGRLFDAVSAMAGVTLEATYEAQAAIELEMLAGEIDSAQGRAYPFALDSAGDVRIVRLGPLVQGVADDVLAGVAAVSISQAFHRTLAQIVAAVCTEMRDELGLDRVALSGGCFQNRQLLRLTTTLLEEQGFAVVIHRQVPANDGGLSLGQAMVAGARALSYKN
jgi:hydrogenase maturation protein HypF